MALPSSGNISLSEIITEYDAQVNLFTTGSGTIAIPATATAVIIETWGGGGSGSARFAQYIEADNITVTYDGSGGGSGQYAYTQVLLSSDSGKIISYTVGAGGSGVQASSSNINSTTRYYGSGGNSSASVTLTAGAYSLIAVGGVGAVTTSGTIVSTGHAFGSTSRGIGGGIGTEYAGFNATGLGTATGTGAFLINGNNGAGGRQKEAGSEPGGSSLTGLNTYAQLSYGGGGGSGGLGSSQAAGSGGAVQITFLSVPTHKNLTSYLRSSGLVANHSGNSTVSASLPISLSQLRSTAAAYQTTITGGSQSAVGVTRWGYNASTASGFAAFGSTSKSLSGIYRSSGNVAIQNIFEQQTTSGATVLTQRLFVSVLAPGITAVSAQTVTVTTQSNADEWVQITATLTPSAGVVGNYYKLTGFSPSTFNGTYQCVASDASSITLNYVDNTAGDSITAGGSIVDATYQYKLLESVTVGSHTFNIDSSTTSGVGAQTTGCLSWYWTLPLQTGGVSYLGLNGTVVASFTPY